MYSITRYTRKRADETGLVVLPSKRKNKKNDVYRDGIFLASVGDKRYLDYPTHLQTEGKKYADERKKLYSIRHKKDSGIAGDLAKKLLW